MRVACKIEAPQQTSFVYWYKNSFPILFDSQLNSTSQLVPETATASAESGAATFRTLLKSDANNASLDSAARNSSAKLKLKLRVAKQHRTNSKQGLNATRNRYSNNKHQNNSRTKLAENANDFRRSSRARKTFVARSNLFIKQVTANDTANYSCVVSICVARIVCVLRRNANSNANSNSRNRIRNKLCTKNKRLSLKASTRQRSFA